MLKHRNVCKSFLVLLALVSIQSQGADLPMASLPESGRLVRCACAEWIPVRAHITTFRIKVPVTIDCFLIAPFQAHQTPPLCINTTDARNEPIDFRRLPISYLNRSNCRQGRGARRNHQIERPPPPSYSVAAGATLFRSKGADYRRVLFGEFSASHQRYPFSNG